MTKVRRAPRRLFVYTLTAASHRGRLTLGMRSVRCAIGKSGWRVAKREGDGATPAGALRLLKALIRRDQRHSIRTRLPQSTIAPADGWCDAVEDRNYNRLVRHPYPRSAEHLWRSDRLYDVVLVLDANIKPRRRGRGSAIFSHIARDGYTGTEGCIAFSKADLLRLLPVLARGDAFIVGGTRQKKKLHGGERHRRAEERRKG